jgi:hypothetical protein
MQDLRLIKFFIIVLSILACKECIAYNGDEQMHNGASRPRGHSIGERIEKIIGKQGGSILSGDGKFEALVPAGALDADVTIAIEPISRTVPGAMEKNSLPAYRLTPHGQRFTKPVTIIFHYTEEEFKKVTPAESIAYQDMEGKWTGFRHIVINETARTVSVHSTHFSDWATYEGVYLEPREDVVVEIGKTTMLKVMTVTPMGLTEADQQKEEYYLEEPSTIPAAVDWRIVNGPGNGTIVGVPTRATAIYTAPGAVPGNNPVEVEAKVDLKKKGYMLLFKSITVVDRIKPGIHFIIDGGEWIHFNDARSLIDGKSEIGDDGEYPYDRHSISIRIAGGHATGVGTWAWDDLGDPDSVTTFEYNAKIPGPRTQYSHRFTNSDFDIWHMSAGYIRITEYKADKTGTIWAIGDFLIEKSTPYIEGATGTPPASRIKGYFKFRVERKGNPQTP